MIQRVEILPYQTLGVHKYEAMGKEYKLNGIKENTLEQLETAKTLFGEYRTFFHKNPDTSVEGAAGAGSG